jgi:hypothetical protein
MTEVEVETIDGREVWYRYTDGYEHINLETFEVVKHTPKGVWLKMGFEWGDIQNRKFVLKDARKRFAYPTQKKAWNSFCIRKRRQQEHLERQLEQVKATIAFIETQDEAPTSSAPHKSWHYRTMPYTDC